MADRASRMFRISSRRSRLAALFMLTLALPTLALLAATPAVAQESAGDLIDDLQRYFTVLPLSDGMLLQPLDQESSPRTVEVSDAGIALDGAPAGDDEVRVRLGEAAPVVLAAARLDGAGRAELLALALGLATAEDDVAEDAAAEDPATDDPEIEDEDAADAEAADEENSLVVSDDAIDEDAEKRESRRRRRRSSSGDTEIVVGSNRTIESDEIVENVALFGGYLKILGRVEGDAAVVGGSVTVEGEVTGDVTAVGGVVRLLDGAHVMGDVASVGGEVYQDDGARVDGDIEDVSVHTNFNFVPWTNWRDWDHYRFEHSFSPWGWWRGLGWKLVRILFLGVLAWLSLLVFRRPIGRMEERLEAEPWKCGLVGLLAVALFVPIVVLLCLFLAVSIIGIPLLIVVPFGVLAAVVVAWLGFVAVAARIGEALEKKFSWQLGSPFWVVLLGLVAVLSLSLVGDLLNFGVAPLRFIAGMFLFFGGVVWFASWVLGTGAAVLTRFGTSETWNRAEEWSAPLPPVPASDASADGVDEGDESADPVWDESPFDDGDDESEADTDEDRDRETE